VGRTLAFNAEAENFGSDREANQHLTRNYRAPFAVPAKA
jgi:hypothetical protein